MRGYELARLVHYKKGPSKVHILEKRKGNMICGAINQMWHTLQVESKKVEADKVECLKCKKWLAAQKKRTIF